jgi:hypothetical protein
MWISPSGFPLFLPYLNIERLNVKTGGTVLYQAAKKKKQALSFSGFCDIHVLYKCIMRGYSAIPGSVLLS